MFKRSGKVIAVDLEEFPDPIWRIIERRRQEAVRGISIAGLAIVFAGGFFNFAEIGSLEEVLTRTVPMAIVFVTALLLTRHDGNAHRSGPILVVLSAVAMIVVRLFSAAEAAGHFLFFPAAAVGGVLLLGFRAGLFMAGATLAGLYIVYFINLYFHPFPVFIPVDRPATFVAAFLMTLTMIVLVGRLLNEVQRKYESTSWLLTVHLDRYRSLISLLTNDLSTSISQMRAAEARNHGEDIEKSVKEINRVIGAARKLRSESFPGG